MNRRTILIVGGIVGFFLFLNGIFFGWYVSRTKDAVGNIVTQVTPVPTPKILLEFAFDNLTKREYLGSKITQERELPDYDGEKHKAYLFSFLAAGKKVTGQMNIPSSRESIRNGRVAYTNDNKYTNEENKNKFPVVIMLRGYVDQAIYKTGVGTNKAARVFADNGYITLAPDFLGYGESDMPKDPSSPEASNGRGDVWWERFFNPVVVLELLASIKNIEQADPTNIYIWAHSNGGQIALSVLEITTLDIPTTLWAPVTKPFPYSILYFTDEFDDEGKALRAEVSRLEADYDVDLFSITKYLKRISAPIQLHQGIVDDAVPPVWSDEFVAKMKELEKEIEYFKYKDADHNLSGAWNEVVKKDLQFFKENRR